jgi:hypothetical protein
MHIPGFMHIANRAWRHCFVFMDDPVNGIRSLGRISKETPAVFLKGFKAMIL